MQITDQQFIDAMYKAVERGGCNRVAPGRYRDNDGAPSCIVGMALAQIDLDLVPWNNSNLAYGLLREHGCSERVALAAHWAQYANDASLGWGDVKTVFNDALSLYDQGYRAGFAFERTMHDRVLILRREAIERRKASALAKPPAPENPTYMDGGVINTGDTNFDALIVELNNLSDAIQKITFPTFGELADKSLAVNPSLVAMGIEPPHTKFEFSLSA